MGQTVAAVSAPRQGWPANQHGIQNHLLLPRISPLITTFTRTKDSIYFDDVMICLLGASFGEVSPYT